MERVLAVVVFAVCWYTLQSITPVLFELSILRVNYRPFVSPRCVSATPTAALAYVDSLQPYVVCLDVVDKSKQDDLTSAVGNDRNGEGKCEVINHVVK